MKRIGKLAVAATAAGAVMTLATAPPVARADSQFLTVTLPANADLTTYDWCASLGCQRPLRLNEPVPAAVYNAITGIPLTDSRRIAALYSYGFGSWATSQAVRRLQSTQPPPGSTVVAAVLLRTPTRTNGGLLTRIMPDAATPPSNFNAFGGSGPPGQRVDTSFVDVAREYDGLADFPSWPNPFSVANAMAGAVFLGNYNDTVTWRDPRCPNGTCTAPTTWPVKLPATTGYVYATVVRDPMDPSKDVKSPFPVGAAVIPTTGDQTVYYTEITRQLPLLTPLQLPFDLINNVINTASQGNLQLRLTNPLVQVLQPPLAILVNLGYTDVNPAAGYSRTLLRPGEKVPFGTLPNLTPAQWLGVPGAVGWALAAGVLDAVKNPFGVFNRPLGSSSTPAPQTNSPVEPRNPDNSPGSELSGAPAWSPLAASRMPDSSAPTVTLSVTTAMTQSADVAGRAENDADGRIEKPHSQSGTAPTTKPNRSLTSVKADPLTRSVVESPPTDTTTGVENTKTSDAGATTNPAGQTKTTAEHAGSGPSGGASHGEPASGGSNSDANQ